MHTVAVTDQPEELDDLPASFPLRRPKLYGYCQAIGLGTTVPCPFASCRHSLLSDELRGETLPDADPWQRETCSLSVAARGRHSSLSVAAITGHVETTIEEFSRRGIARVLVALGCDELVILNKRGEPRRYKHAQLHGYKIQATETDGLGLLLEARLRRPMPPLKVSPARWLSRAEAEAAYPGKVSPHYGEPKDAPGAPGGAVAAQPGQETENAKETAAPAAGESNRQNGARGEVEDRKKNLLV